MKAKSTIVIGFGAFMLAVSTVKSGTLTTPALSVNGSDFIWSGVGGVQVYDATRQNLGILLDLSNTTILNKPSGHIFSIVKVSNISTESSSYYVQPWSTESYVYASDDCSGDPLRILQGGLNQAKPVDLTGSVDLVKRDIYSEFKRDDSLNWIFTGRTIGLGSILTEERNQSDNTIVAAAQQIRSVVGTWGVSQYNHGFEAQCAGIGITYTPLGCTVLRITEIQPSPPPKWIENPDGTLTYKGIDYADWNALEHIYCSDVSQYMLDSAIENINVANNGIPPHTTRWVYRYSEVKLPLRQPFAAPFTFK